MAIEYYLRALDSQASEGGGELRKVSQNNGRENERVTAVIYSPLV